MTYCFLYEALSDLNDEGKVSLFFFKVQFYFEGNGLQTVILEIGKVPWCLSDRVPFVNQHQPVLMVISIP